MATDSNIDIRTQIEEQFEQKIATLAKLNEEKEDLLGKHSNLLSKEYTKSINELVYLLQGLEKVRNRLEEVEERNERAKLSIERGREKIENLKHHKEKLEEKIQKTKKSAEKVDSVCNFLGIHITTKERHCFQLEFSKLPINDYGRTFTFEVTTEVNNKLRVVPVDPSDSIVVEEIENRVNSLEDRSNRFMTLIVLLRRELIDKYKE